MSATIFKRFLKCPAAAYNEPIIDSEAMQIGREVDVRLLGGEPTTLLTPKTGKPSAKEKIVQEMVDKAKSSAKFMASLEGEHQKEFEFQIEGIDWKCKLDNYNQEKGFISDLKTTRTLKEQYNPITNQFEKPWILWDYDIQMAIYAFATGIDKVFLSFIAKDNLDLRIVEVPKEVLRNALYDKILPKNKEVAEQYFEGKNLWRCGKCAYCIGTRTDEEMMGDWYEG
jgi:hypothetical protein